LAGADTLVLFEFRKPKAAVLEERAREEAVKAKAHREMDVLFIEEGELGDKFGWWKRNGEGRKAQP
jgi:hypothetical protein